MNIEQTSHRSTSVKWASVNALKPCRLFPVFLGIVMLLSTQALGEPRRGSDNLWINYARTVVPMFSNINEDPNLVDPGSSKGGDNASKTKGWGWVPGKPGVGEFVVIEVSYGAEVNSFQPFDIEIVLPGGIEFRDTVNTIGDTHYINVGVFNTSEELTFIATVDPDNTYGESSTLRQDNSKKGKVSFQLPSVAIESYNTVSWHGSQGAIIEFSDDADGRLVATFGTPVSAPNQIVSNRTAHAHIQYGDDLDPLIDYQETFDFITSSPHTYPVYRMDVSDHVEDGFTAYFWQEFDVELSAVRVNHELLDEVTWEDIDNLWNNSFYQRYLQSDGDIIDVDGPLLTWFVDLGLQLFPERYETPYQAARELYLKTMKHMEYVLFYPSFTSELALANGKGDCGTYAMLWVAALRRVGIPARTVSGFWPNGGTHVWAEFYLPGAGWVPGDPSAADANFPDSSVPYMLGTLVYLYTFMATARGNTFTVDGSIYHWLYYPIVEHGMTTPPPVYQAGAGLELANP